MFCGRHVVRLQDVFAFQYVGCHGGVREIWRQAAVALVAGVCVAIGSEVAGLPIAGIVSPYRTIELEDVALRGHPGDLRHGYQGVSLIVVDFVVVVCQRGVERQLAVPEAFHHAQIQVSVVLLQLRLAGLVLQVAQVSLLCLSVLCVGVGVAAAIGERPAMSQLVAHVYVSPPGAHPLAAVIVQATGFRSLWVGHPQCLQAPVIVVHVAYARLRALAVGVGQVHVV